MARPPYGSVLPQDAAAAVFAVAGDRIPGLPSNPPSVQRAIEALKLDNEFTRPVVDTVRGSAPAPKANPGKRKRQFVLTCQNWIEQDRYLYCKVNPNQVSWNMNLRVSEQKTLAGTVQHAWRNLRSVQRPSFFSEPVLQITFQSGNIMPVVPAEYRDPRNSRQDVTVSDGLNNFYQFVDLLNEARIVDDASNDRRANVVYILYTSQLYPTIVLAGMFNSEGFSFTDSAEDPNKVQWTSSFTVYDSFPRFDDSSELLATWDIADRPPLQKQTPQQTNNTQNGTNNGPIAENGVSATTANGTNVA